MKKFMIVILISLGLSSGSLLAANAKSTTKNEAKNIAFITQLYKEIYEKKDFDHMNGYLSGEVRFYKNFSSPLNYDALKDHLVEQGSACVKIKMLPFDSILASGNKVVTLYTRQCTDKADHVEKRRVMAITEINNLGKVSNIWVVSHEASE